MRDNQGSTICDGLDRLTQWNRGSLTGTPPDITQAAANYSQEWLHLEHTGNRNRLVKVQADSGGAPGTTIVEFQYDGRHRRIVKLKPNGSNWDRTDYYYEAWQCLEERFLGNTASKTTVATAPKVRYVWDLRYLDALAVRWRDADSNGSIEEKVYSCQDANANVTALVNASGTVLERYSYDAYGKVSIWDAA